MSAFRKSSVSFVALSALVAGCGGGGGGRSPPPPGTPPPITVLKNFSPSTFPGVTGTLWSIAQVRTVLFASSAFPSATELYDSLEIDTTLTQSFAGALPPPGSQLTQPNQLGVSPIFFTGASTQGSSITGCGGQFANYVVSNGNVARLADGNYYILDDILQPTTTGGGPATEAVTTVSGNTVKQVVMLPEIGVFSTAVPDIRIQVGVSNGTNGTDCEPQGLSVIKTNGQP